MNKRSIIFALFSLVGSVAIAQRSPVDYVNPLLGTATIWDKKDAGFQPTHRVWGAEVFPGSSLPNAMVQLTPVTQFHSGSGYQYEDTTIFGFAHTSKGHWNLCNIPILPATGNFSADDYASPFRHNREVAHPGYYSVVLDRYGVKAELSSTLRCAFHKYQYKSKANKRLIVNLPMANERVRSWDIEKTGTNSFTGFQQCGETMYFYAVTNQKIRFIDTLKKDKLRLPVVEFSEGNPTLEVKIGFSFVSIANAKENLEKEMLNKQFSQVRNEAAATWNTLLSKIKVSGGTERHKRLFYSCLYRSFLWPALRSDVNGEFTNPSGKVVKKNFNYYTEPSLWDDYRNKLILLGLLSPKVTADVIQSLIEKGRPTGFMPTFFHGDHASSFITGSYLRGIRGFNVKEAYQMMLNNAYHEGTRKYVEEYEQKGYISEQDIPDPQLETVAKAAVTKTLEYAYDDYAVALLAKALNDTSNYHSLMQRTSNYKNLFDPATKLMRGRLADGSWIKKFNPYFPYYEYMYREANAWQSSFFVPHDVQGLISLYPNKAGFEQKLDSLFSIPWKGYEAYNLSGFIGQYCQGNQPDHSYPFLYYFVGKQQKSQVLLDSIMNRFYDMGKEHLAYAGMDDAGEMSSWFVFSALGFYPFSPADPQYIISVPLFDRIDLQLDNHPFQISKVGKSKKISKINLDGRTINGFYLQDRQLKSASKLTIITDKLK
ncbi:glycoside hydrolase family 92 protein [Mucilaginibacter robiniae]|uniref:Glycoside hydrolase family 92 protein n=1 Tax=Mucilaginibacter robiniae TaxID=2728022 RepID=A0A7L5DXA5_9SPHI|nr:GH92 family glycosyl hydrolase [Mucilaginibacter robiniae]QJD95730.1 glycoside hydrolase family 92 protein [Mucilaginibacter robiniae]